MPMKKFFFKYVHNRFFYTGLFFVVWMVFFDQENLIVQNRLSNTLQELQQQKTFYLEETASNKQTIRRLESDTAALEKLAREKYYMKRDNEDVYVIVKKKN
jgi:cell division protein FtsB